MSNRNRSKRYDVADKEVVKANGRREKKEGRINKANGFTLVLGAIVIIVALAFPGLLSNILGVGFANFVKFVALVAIILALIAQRRGNDNIFELIRDGIEMLLPYREYEYDGEFEDELEVSPKRICANCKEVLPAGKDFCPNCGTKYVPVAPPAKRICTNCGEEMLEGKDFCANCGTKYVAPEKRICKKCKSELLEGKDFCAECGTKYVAATSKK